MKSMSIGQMESKVFENTMVHARMAKSSDKIKMTMESTGRKGERNHMKIILIESEQAI